MFILRKLLKKDPKELTPEEKAFVGKHWDLLNDELRAKFADAKPEDADEDKDGDEEEDKDGDDDEDEEGDDKKGLDAKALEALIGQKSQKQIDKKAEQIALAMAKAFGQSLDAAHAKFAKDGKTVEGKNVENDRVTRDFIKALISSDHKALKELAVTQKAMTTADDDDAAAGHLIPDALLNEVLRIESVGYGIARQEFGYHLISVGNSLRVTALGTTLGVFWVDEGEKKPSSQPAFSLVTLTLKKLAVIVPMTEETVEDSGVNLTELIAQLIREAIDKEVDLQFFNGTGSPWTGLLNDTAIPSNILAATKYSAAIRPEDIMALADDTPLSVNGKYYMHRTVLSKIRTLRQNADGTGDYIYNPLGGGDFGTLNGRPLVLSEAFPTLTEANAANKPIMLYGDLKRGVAYGEKSGIRFKLLDQATVTDVDGETVLNLAEQDMLAVRAVQRVGFKVTLASAMNRLVSGPAS